MINGMGNHSSTVNGANAGGDHFVMVATSDDLCDEANPCGTSGEPETTAAPAPVQTKSARVVMEHAVESDDDADEDEAVDGAGEEEDLLETYPDETEVGISLTFLGCIFLRTLFHIYTGNRPNPRSSHDSSTPPSIPLCLPFKASLFPSELLNNPRRRGCRQIDTT